MTRKIYEINEGWDVGSGSDGGKSDFTEETTRFYRFEEGEEARGDPRAAFCGRTARFRLRNRAVEHGRAAGRVPSRSPPSSPTPPLPPRLRTHRDEPLAWTGEAASGAPRLPPRPPRPSPPPPQVPAPAGRLAPRPVSPSPSPLRR